MAEYGYDAYFAFAPWRSVAYNAPSAEVGTVKYLTNIYSIGTINPFRYRGYYQDQETGFYYLQTRYYDPVTRRFLSPDNYELLGTLANSGELNLYTYCLNNPVMYTDSTGMASEWLKDVGRFLAGLAITVLAVSLTINFAFLSQIPVLASIPLFTLNMAVYGGALMASSWDSTINNDLKLIGYNPFNTNAEAALQSQKISFYKGTTMVRGNFPGCASFGIMFIDKGDWVNADVLRHEYGHYMQFQLFGVIEFSAIFAIPSLISAAVSPLDHDYRYFETFATWLGNLY